MPVTTYRALSFVYNWNKKLDCDCFTTIRIRNDGKYFRGQKLTVFLQNNKKEVLENKGNVIIEEVRYCKLHDLNNFMVRIDTGLQLEEGKRKITNFYKNKGIDWRTQDLSIILCVKDKPTVKQTSLFNQLNINP